MTAFAAPIAEQIWDMKYRFKDADGTPKDKTVQDTWRRIARDLARAEDKPEAWEDVFYDALSDFKYLRLFHHPAQGRGRQRGQRGCLWSVVLHGCVGCDVPYDHVGGIATRRDDGDHAL